MEDKKLVGVTSKVTMSRTLYVEVPNDSSEEDILNKARQEILLPHNALIEANNVLNKVGVRVTGLDLKDWEVIDSEYTIV